MYYLDANAFIYAALYDGPKANGATRLLKRIVDGKESGATAALTIDEVVWILSRETDRETAIEQGRRILDLPNLRIFDVEAEHTIGMLATMDRHEQLSPRDAIHLAVMEAHGLGGIVSDDHDFETLPDVQRHALESFDGS